MDKKSRETLAFMAWNEAINDPELIELKKERDRKIKLIEDEYHRKYLKIRDKYWKKTNYLKEERPIKLGFLFFSHFEHLLYWR